MPNTLLVVDGRGHPRPLTERLGALGYVCLYARGPLRARALLTQHTVDLILWKDNTGNADLSGELLDEWSRHPRIPVVRLFSKGAVTPEGIAPDRLERTVAANLSADAPEYQLFTTLSRCLSGGAAFAERRPGNELAFRHLVTSLRDQPSAGSAGRLPHGKGPDTGLSVTERELLREATPSSSDNVTRLIKPWRRVWNRWVGARRARSAS